MYPSTGGLIFRRRSAQYSVSAGSSGDAPPLTMMCRTMSVQANRARWAPLAASPNTQRLFLNLLNLPK